MVLLKVDTASLYGVQKLVEQGEKPAVSRQIVSRQVVSRQQNGTGEERRRNLVG
jgi:hypothetical protein